MVEAAVLEELFDPDGEETGRAVEEEEDVTVGETLPRPLIPVPLLVVPTRGEGGRAMVELGEEETAEAGRPVPAAVAVVTVATGVRGAEDEKTRVEDNGVADDPEEGKEEGLDLEGGTTEGLVVVVVVGVLPMCRPTPDTRGGVAGGAAAGGPGRLALVRSSRVGRAGLDVEEDADGVAGMGEVPRRRSFNRASRSF